MIQVRQAVVIRGSNQDAGSCRAGNEFFFQLTVSGNRYAHVVQANTTARYVKITVRA